MIDVVVEYPFMLFRRKAVGKAPSAWNELTQHQFIAISRVVNGKTPDYRFLSVLTGIPKELLKKLSAFELLKLSERINFIGRAGASHSDFIIGELYTPPHRLLCPTPKLGSLTFGQFIFMDAYYNDYAFSKDEAALNKFIASIYLPKGEKFNSEMIQGRVDIVVKTDIHTRRAIAMNYSLVAAWLQLAYPLVFSESKQSEPDQEPKPPSSSPWIGIFESLVGDDLINRDRYADLPIHTVLRTLTKRYKENARTKSH